MDDAELVEAARDGDQHAWAAVYDRYTDRIHDFVYATLRDREQAVDVVKETFLVAFERLGQLGDPSRLGPWLYAIAHKAALDRVPAPDGPAGPGAGDLTEVVPVVCSRAGVATPAPPPARTSPPSPASPPEAASRQELTDFVWQASGALGARDRALLDLHLRQGLHGRDLADAVGSSPGRLATVLNRLRAQFERSVGALLVAKSSRRDCPQLAEILTRWDGVVTPEWRALITAHVDDCETCNSRRRLMLNPLEALASVPRVPAPAFVRRVVLGRSTGGGAAAAAGWIFDTDGFPYQGGDRQVEEPGGAGAGAIVAIAAASYDPLRSSYTSVVPATDRFVAPAPAPHGPADRRGVLIGALVGVIILIGGIVALVASRGPSGSSGRVAVAPTSTAAPKTTVPPATTVSATTTTKAAAPTTVPPGHFVVGAKGLDFGTSGVAQSLVVGNDGAGPLAFTATTPVAAVTIAPASGNISPAASTTLTVSLNRAAAPPGMLSTTIAISSGAGTAIVAVTAEIDPGPSITGEQASPDTVRPTVCLTTAPTQATVTAQIAAPVPPDKSGVRLHFDPPTGSDAKMVLNGSTATGTLGPYLVVPPNGTIEWWITVIDAQGQSATTTHHFITVSC